MTRVAERGTLARPSRALYFGVPEIKAGIFLTFCLALFIGMLFVLGKFGRAWRGHEEIRVLFNHVSALRRDAPVRYNGMDLGRVQSLKIIRLGPGLLFHASGRLPPLTPRDLPNLPLTEEEREQLARLQIADSGLRIDDFGPPLPAPANPQSAIPNPQSFDSRVRALLEGRTMVLLTLDVLSENDTRRFHEDDEYRIAGSLMGDSAVEIRTGCGSPMALRAGRLFLGVGGDMYTDLGKSISQVKDILASMAEMVGGEHERASIRSQLQAFESYTGRIESAAGSIETKAAQAWDNVDTRLGDGANTFADVAAKLKDLRPQVDSAMESANKSILEARDSLAKSVDSAREKVRSLRKDAADKLGEWRTQAAGYKDSIPSKIHSAREWSERFMPTVDKLDHFLTRADDQLDKGIASTRATLANYLVTAARLEETTYRLKRWPASFAHEPDKEAAKLQDLVWRRELASRQYTELRGELERLWQGLSDSKAATGASDRERLARVEKIIREVDQQLDAARKDDGGRMKKKR